MRDIILDITPFEEKKTLHSYLKTQLDFPFYYGANLDALFDELTATTDLTAVTLQYPAQPKGKMVEYIPRLIAVFEDAARENYNLTVRFEVIG